MANAEIRETIVTPDANGAISVQLYISDLPRDSEGAAIRLTLAVQVPAFEMPLVAHLQREALDLAMDVLRSLNQDLGKQIMETHHDLNPSAKGKSQ